MPRTRSTTGLASPAAAAETVIASISGLVVPVGDPVDIEASCDITIGLNGTAVTLRIERGSAVGGFVVATYGPFTVINPQRYNFTINAVDLQPIESSNIGYVLTVAVTAATAISTVNAVYIGAIY